MAHQTKYLHMETKFSSHKRYLFGLVFSRNAKKTHTDQSILPTFLLSLKRSVSKTLEKSSCKKVFPKCVFYGSNLLRECFSFLVITGRHSFSIQSCGYPEVWCNRHVAEFFEISILKEVCIIYPIIYPLSPQQH